MAESNSSSDQAGNLRKGFNNLAPTYDRLRFLRLCSARLAELAALPRGARVLDVATGTGEVALHAARAVGPTGQVVGVDLSPGMLERAREKLAGSDLGNLRFLEGDAARLQFPDQSFDYVLCASSLFFFPDHAGTLREWRRVLAPGGRVAFSSFGASFLQPLYDLWVARMGRRGLRPAPLPTELLSDPSTSQRLLVEAGFDAVEAKIEQLGYYLRTPEERWADIEAGLEGKPLLELDPAGREEIRAQHLTELAALATTEGIWLDVPALFFFGRKAD
jgi:ubiquinone/menaquinone biosynthesis C-methylase UbiE